MAKSPAVGTHKVGWLRDIVIDHVMTRSLSGGGVKRG